MKIAFYDTHNFEKPYYEKLKSVFKHEVTYIDSRLTLETAGLSQGAECVCCFVNDSLKADVLKELKASGVKLIALRSAGFNHVDLKAAAELGLKVVRVPEYSPYAVAEHAVGMIMMLNRKLHRSYNRVRDENFSLNGLVGFDLYKKTVGVAGTGKIGKVFAKIMSGFGCKILLYDLNPDQSFAEEINAEYVPLDNLLTHSDIISLHVPLTPATTHLINEAAIHKMKTGVMIINTGRGRLLDTQALIKGLKSCKIGYAGLDVYEEEEGVFFNDLSETGIQDDCLARLLTFPNVFVTSHQAFLTKEALENIAQTTLENIASFEANKTLTNEVVL